MSSRAKRVLIAGLFHETHTFLEGFTPLSSFFQKRGQEIMAAVGDAAPTSGALEVGIERGWEIVPALDFRAIPSAMVTDDVVETWWSEFKPIAEKTLQEGALDGVFLVLHGAMASETIPDVEGELLERLRGLPGYADILICGCTDLHVNFSARMAKHSNVLITYRKNPHTDAKETAVRAAELMDRLMHSGQKPVTLFAHPPVMWPPTGTGTADEPMKALEALAREIEDTCPDIVSVNVHAGFSFADTPETGVSFTVCTVGDTVEAQQQLDRLTELALRTKETGNVLQKPVEEVMPRVKELLAAGETPIILVEPSDNIGAGAPGDGTGILKALMRHEIDGGCVIIDDAAAVAEVSKLSPGGKTTLTIGGKGSRLSEGPVTLEAELVSTSDGKFDLEDLHSHAASMFGAHFDMGPCAVIRSNGITILLTTVKTAPMDLGQLRSQGIIPEEQKVIGVKAAVAHRQAYDPITRHSFTVDTPGPCSSDLKTLPFKLVDRPVFPLD